jgi:sugar phosphate isomerase/epimerase
MKKSAVISTPEVGEWPYALFTGTFEEKLHKATEICYDGVELLFRDINKVDGGKINKEIRQSGLQVPAIVTGAIFGIDRLCLISPDPEISKRAVEQLYGLLEFAAAFGAVVDIGVLRGRLDWMPDPPKARDQLLEHFRRAAEYAARVGSKVTLEPICRFEVDIIRNAQEGLYWVREVNRPCFGLMLDTFHMNIEDASIESSLREAAPFLWHIHISDSNRLSPGQGHFDFPNMFRILKEINYQGFVSVEQLALPDPDTAALVSIKHIQKFD